MTELVNKFNAENDDIEIVYEVYSDNYPQTIEISATTNSLPDIMALNMAVINTLLPRDMFTYIDNLIPADFRARFDDGMFVEGINMKDGKIFTLPNTGVALRLVYNKDIFARAGLPGPPQTVQQMADYSQQITSQLSGEGIYGFALPMRGPTSALSRGIRSIPQLSGYPVWEGYDFAQGKFDWSSYKPAIEALRTIFTSGAAFPGCESLDIDPLRTQFADGKIGMYMTYSHSEWGVFKDQFPMEQEWGYAPLPT
jgi:multiple sugar transport system substrate-binding protein